MPRIPEKISQRTLIDDLIDARTQVLLAASTLPADRVDVPFLGAWSAHDILAHLIGWDYANLDAVAAIRSSRLPGFYSAYDSDWHSFNALLVRRHKRAAVEETLACVGDSHHVLIDALERLPVGELAQDYGVRSAGGRRVTIAMLVQAEAGDERKHAEQIRTFAKQIAEG